MTPTGRQQRDIVNRPPGGRRKGPRISLYCDFCGRKQPHHEKWCDWKYEVKP
jgi:hypothetical protein